MVDFAKLNSENFNRQQPYEVVERAAIMEYDAGMTRGEAERRAVMEGKNENEE